ncbi:MAG: hypothetical protein ACTSP4_09910, partial [Candidatus Hodarchaeales archaeon]
MNFIKTWHYNKRSELNLYIAWFMFLLMVRLITYPVITAGILMITEVIASSITPLATVLMKVLIAAVIMYLIFLAVLYAWKTKYVFTWYVFLLLMRYIGYPVFAAGTLNTTGEILFSTILMVLMLLTVLITAAKTCIVSLDKFQSWKGKHVLAAKIKAIHLNKAPCIVLLLFMTVLLTTQVAVPSTAMAETSGEEAIANSVLKSLVVFESPESRNLMAYFDDGENDNGDHWSDTKHALENIILTGNKAYLDKSVRESLLISGNRTRLSGGRTLLGEAVANWILSERTVRTEWKDEEKITRVTGDNGTVELRETVTVPYQVPEWRWGSSFADTVTALRILELTGNLDEKIIHAVKEKMVTTIIDNGGYDWDMNSRSWDQTNAAINLAHEYGYFDLLENTTKITHSVLSSSEKPLFERITLLENETTGLQFYPGEVIPLEMTVKDNESRAVIDIADYSLANIFGIENNLLLPSITLTIDVNSSSCINSEDLEYSLLIGLANNVTTTEQVETTSLGIKKLVEIDKSEIIWDGLTYNLDLELEDCDGIVKSTTEVISGQAKSFTWEISDPSNLYTITASMEQVLHSVEMVFDGKVIQIPYTIDEELLYGASDDYHVLINTSSNTVEIFDFTGFDELLNQTFGPDKLDWPDTDFNSPGEMDRFLESYLSMMEKIPSVKIDYIHGEKQQYELGGVKHEISFKNPHVPVEADINVSITVPPVAILPYHVSEREGDTFFNIARNYLSPAKIISIPATTTIGHWDDLWDANEVTEGWLFGGTGQPHVRDSGEYLALLFPTSDELANISTDGEKTLLYDVNVEKWIVENNLADDRPLERFTEFFNTTFPLKEQEDGMYDFDPAIDYITYFEQYINTVDRITAEIPLGTVVNINNIIQTIQSLKNTTTFLYDNSLGQTLKVWKIYNKLGLGKDLIPLKEIDSIYHHVMDKMAVEERDDNDNVVNLAFKEKGKIAADLETTNHVVNFLVTRNERIEQKNEIADLLSPHNAVIIRQGTVYTREGDYYQPLAVNTLTGKLLEQRTAIELQNSAGDPLLLADIAADQFRERLVEYDLAFRTSLTIKRFDSLLDESDIYWVEEIRQPSSLEQVVTIAMLVVFIAAVFIKTDGKANKSFTGLSFLAIFSGSSFVIPLSAMTGQAQSPGFYLDGTKYAKLIGDFIYEISDFFQRPVFQRSRMNVEMTTIDEWDGKVTGNIQVEEELTVDKSYESYTSAFYTSKIDQLPQMTLVKSDDKMPELPVSYITYMTNILAIEGNRYIETQTTEIERDYREEAEKIAAGKESVINAILEQSGFYKSIVSGTIQSKGRKGSMITTIFHNLSEVEKTFTSTKKFLTELQEAASGSSRGFYEFFKNTTGRPLSEYSKKIISKSKIQDILKSMSISTTGAGKNALKIKLGNMADFSSIIIRSTDSSFNKLRYIYFNSKDGNSDVVTYFVQYLNSQIDGGHAIVNKVKDYLGRIDNVGDVKTLCSDVLGGKKGITVAIKNKGNMSNGEAIANSLKSLSGELSNPDSKISRYLNKILSSSSSLDELTLTTVIASGSTIASYSCDLGELSFKQLVSMNALRGINSLSTKLRTPAGRFKSNGVLIDLLMNDLAKKAGYSKDNIYTLYNKIIAAQRTRNIIRGTNNTMFSAQSSHVLSRVYNSATSIPGNVLNDYGSRSKLRQVFAPELDYLYGDEISEAKNIIADFVKYHRDNLARSPGMVLDKTKTEANSFLNITTQPNGRLFGVLAGKLRKGISFTDVSAGNIFVNNITEDSLKRTAKFAQNFTAEKKVMDKMDIFNIFASEKNEFNILPPTVQRKLMNTCGLPASSMSTRKEELFTNLFYREIIEQFEGRPFNEAVVKVQVDGIKVVPLQIVNKSYMGDITYVSKKHGLVTIELKRTATVFTDSTENIISKSQHKEDITRDVVNSVIRQEGYRDKKLPGVFEKALKELDDGVKNRTTAVFGGITTYRKVTGST